MKSWHQSESFQYPMANACIICFTSMFCVLFRDIRSLFALIALSHRRERNLPQLLDLIRKDKSVQHKYIHVSNDVMCEDA